MDLQTTAALLGLAPLEQADEVWIASGLIGLAGFLFLVVIAAMFK